MDHELFASMMMKGSRPSQNFSEWKMFLQIADLEMEKRNIVKPVVVELGIWRNRQKKFYEEFLGAEHICIDVSAKRGMPDILGDTHDPKTMAELLKRLNGRPINVLFIDAGHVYEDAKKDFEYYSPLCSDVIALHDINCHRYANHPRMQVHRLWDELKLKAYNPIEKIYKQFLFVDLYRYRGQGNGHQMGIGLMIRQ